MSIDIELVNEAGRPVAAPRYILDVAKPFLERAFGSHWRHANSPILLLWPYPWEGNQLDGDRPLDYLTDPIGFIQVRIVLGRRVFYRHPHTVAEMLEPGLRQWLDELGPEVRPVAYRITGPDIDPLIRRATPIPKWVTEVIPYAPGERPAFRIRPIPPPPPPEATLADFGAAPPGAEWRRPGHTDFVKVLLDQGLQNDLLRRRPLSAEVEEGGFLVGQVYQDREQPEGFILHLMDAVPAEQVGASFLHFTFSGDSFDRVQRRLIQGHQDQRLLGWFHTHLFPAAETMGLSSIDLHLHFTTFRIEWQVAGLLNLDGDNRVLRFYVRRGDSMALCHHQAIGPRASAPGGPA